MQLFQSFVFAFFHPMPKYFPYCFTLEHPQPVSSLNMGDQVSHPGKNRRNCVLLFVFTGCKRENKIMGRMVAGIQFNSALKFFLYVILIYLCPVQILEFCHIFKGLISLLYAVIWSSVMLTRQEQLISFWHLLLNQLSY